MPLDDLIRNKNGRGAGGAARRSTRRETNRSAPYARQPSSSGRRAQNSSAVREREPFKNEGGYSHIQGATIEDIANAPADQRVLKVGSGSDPKKVAGSICHLTRAGGAPALLALREVAINQATKAVAIARGYLIEEQTYLYCQPEYRDTKHSSLCLHLLEVSNLKPGRGKEVELTASKSTDPKSLAGAIAGKIREDAKVSISAIGVDAVNAAISAIAYAREYLVEDERDLYCMPKLVNIMNEDEESLTAMKIKVAWANYGDDVTPVS